MADKPKVWYEGDGGNIVGRCKACKLEVRALGLVPIDDKMMFGKFIDGGWYCSTCRPRQFGRISGKAPLGIPMAPGYVKPTSKGLV